MRTPRAHYSVQDAEPNVLTVQVESNTVYSLIVSIYIYIYVYTYIYIIIVHTLCGS